MVKKKREDYALEIINRWGPLKAKQIQSMALTAMGESEEDAYPIKTLYAHLKKMVLDDVINEELYGPDGELLDEEADHGVKNPRKLYVGKEPTQKIAGSDLIEELGGDVHTPAALRPFFNIFEGLAGVPSETEIHLYMNINQGFVNLRMDVEVFNSGILIARKNPEEIENVLDSIGSNFDKRTLLLELPHPKISSYKETSDSGHCFLSFSNEETVKVKDLGSTNGTRIKVISADDAEVMRRKGELIGEATMTSDWSNVPIHEEIKLAEKEEREVRMPFILDLGGEFKILVAHSEQVSA